MTMVAPVCFRIPRSRSTSVTSSIYSFVSSVFIFSATITIILLHCQVSDGSTQDASLPPLRRVRRQLGFGGFGTSLLASLAPPPHPQQSYNRRQQPSAEASFFNTMMALNFDMTEVFAMYRNVTAVTETPGCLGHCRTPIALWVVQSFYPCYNMKKADCPRGLVCCMQDPTQRIASPNMIHDSRVKSPGIRDRGHGQLHRHPLPPSSSEDSSAQPSSASAHSSVANPTAGAPTESTTLFDEEYYRNNFIQDEIPE